MTTNLTPPKLRTEYARCFSLLEAKQQRIHVKGDDVRANGDKKLIDLELARNGEARPIK